MWIGSKGEPAFVCHTGIIVCSSYGFLVPEISPDPHRESGGKGHG